MLLLSCCRLSRGFDAGPLFEDIGFELRAGDRVGLVGPNGVGKTTLLRLLAGIDQPDDGEVRLHAGARIRMLSQQPDYEPGRSLLDEARSALDELAAAHDEMVRVAEALAVATDEKERKQFTDRYDRLNELLHHHDAYNVDHRVEKVLDGLGFLPADHGRAVDTFSGGQQSRLMLAKLLLSAPDVMLLDEPSNHLDIAATRWLEDYLADQHEAMLIVSHDRYFLDKVVTKIFELAPTLAADQKREKSGRIRSFPGNYRDYVKLREERYELEMKAWEAQREFIDKQEDYIRRVHYGQLHKQAQSRKKVLDKLERVERPTLVETPYLHFGEVRRSGDVVLHVSDLSKSYDRSLFAGLNFTVERGKRLGILGPNGSGKTTLLRILMGEELPTSGKAVIGHLVEFAYYDQHLKELADDQEVIRAVKPTNGIQATDQQMRDLLARFGLTGGQIYQHVGDLSGGERSRAALAKLVAQGANVLVLDEPTNHLDLWACEALEQALLDFEGTVIVVSHDRYFLNRVVDQLLVLESSDRSQVIHGNYDTYETMCRAGAGSPPLAGRSGGAALPGKTSAGDVKAQEESSRQPKKRKRRFPYRKVEDLEAEIAQTETRLRELEQLMASPDLYRDGPRVKETTRQFEETKAQLKLLYEHWEEAEELS